jgi:hypothetical protein
MVENYPIVINDAGRSKSKRPKQDNDCTVRATATVFSIPYDQAYDLLKFHGRKSHKGFHYNELADELVIDGKALKWRAFQAVKGQRRMNPVSFSQRYPVGRFIVRTAGHVFAFINGVAYDDTPEGPNRCIYGAWEVI